MRIIGLTGSIACGKSTVSTYLISQGFPVIDGDKLSRDITVPGSPVLPALRQAFGPDIFYEDGTLNRRKLGRIVFSDPSSRSVLDNLMTPYLLSETKQRIEAIRSRGADLCFLDMPLLYEKGFNRLCDSVWTVWLPEDIQLHRLMQRDGYSREEALSRIHSVLSSDEKARLADRVIDNSGSVNHTLSVVSDLVEEERAKANLPSQSDPYSGSGKHLASAPADPGARMRPPDGFSMQRPEYARTKRNGRKSSWRLPVWLSASLIVFFFALLTGITAQLLMNAFLQQCSVRHKAEAESIDRHYPLVYKDYIVRYADEYNLSPAFVSSVILNESSFQPTAESGVGARGLMQLMPETAEWIAGKLKMEGYAFERMLDPESNIRFGCWYLRYLSNLYLGDPVSVTAAYHAGQGQVKVWLSNPEYSENGYSLLLGTMPEGPTKIYTGRVLRDYGIYQAKYFEKTSDSSPDPDLADGKSGGPGI